jgi:hypothetical protein
LRVSAESDTLRRMEHLLRVQKYLAEQIVAIERTTAAKRQAAAAGCTPDEIAAAVRMIERAAAGR